MKYRTNEREKKIYIIDGIQTNRTVHNERMHFVTV